MTEREKSLENVKHTDEKAKPENRNEHHNSKKQALGPNTKR